MPGQCRNFQHTSDGSEYTGPDDDHEITVEEWAREAGEGEYLMDIPLD
jgi:hypothetical protein